MCVVSASVLFFSSRTYPLPLVRTMMSLISSINLMIAGCCDNKRVSKMGNFPFVAILKECVKEFLTWKVASRFDIFPLDQYLGGFGHLGCSCEIDHKITQI